MKGNTLKSIVVLSSLFFGAQTHAANGNGTVHFTGEIIDSTCEVSTGTKDQTVDLGKVNKSTFTGVGSMASVQAFQIDLLNCPDTYKKASARFDGTEDGDVSTQSRSVTIGAKQRCHALVQRMRLTASLYTSERSLFPTEITKTTTFSSITWYTRR